MAAPPATGLLVVGRAPADFGAGGNSRKRSITLELELALLGTHCSTLGSRSTLGTHCSTPPAAPLRNFCSIEERELRESAPAPAPIPVSASSSCSCAHSSPAPALIPATEEESVHEEDVPAPRGFRPKPAGGFRVQAFVLVPAMLRGGSLCKLSDEDSGRARSREKLCALSTAKLAESSSAVPVLSTTGALAIGVAFCFTATGLRTASADIERALAGARDAPDHEDHAPTLLCGAGVGAADGGTMDFATFFPSARLLSF